MNGFRCLKFEINDGVHGCTSPLVAKYLTQPTYGRNRSGVAPAWIFASASDSFVMYENCGLFAGCAFTYDANIACLRSAGFTPTQVAHAYAVVDAFVYGFVLQETSLPFQTGPEAADLVSSGPLAELVATHPNMAWFAEHVVLAPGYAFAREFEPGLDLVLDGIAALLDPSARVDGHPVLLVEVVAGLDAVDARDEVHDVLGQRLHADDGPAEPLHLEREDLALDLPHPRLRAEGEARACARQVGEEGLERGGVHASIMPAEVPPA